MFDLLKLAQKASVIKLLKETFFTNAYIMAINQTNGCTRLHTCPFHVENGKVVLTTSKTGKIIGIVNRVFVTFMLSVYGLRTLHRMTYDENLKQTDMILDMGWSALVYSCCAYKMEYFRKGEETVLLLNTTHEWERQHISEGVRTIYKGWNEEIIWPLMAWIIILAIYAFPVAVGVLALLKPCSNILIGSMVFPCDEGTYLGSSGIAAVFAVVEWFSVYQIFCPGALATGPGNYYIMISIRTFLTTILKKRKQNFDWTTKIMYRRFQIYIGMVNVCLSSVVFPGLISGWCVLIVVGVYTGLKLFGTVAFPLYMLFVILAFDGLTVVSFSFKDCGEVEKLSQFMVGKWKVALWKNGNQIRANRKEIASFAPLRVQIGSSNFFEMSTPLQILSLCLDNIINLLLAS